MVTIVGPSQAASQRLRPGGSRGARCPLARSAREQVGCSSAGSSRELRRAPGPSRASRTSRPSLAARVQQRAPRLDRPVEGQGLAIVEAMARDRRASAWPQGRSFHHSRFAPERIAAEREQQRVGVPAGARVRRDGRADRGRAARAARARARSTRSWSSTRPRATAPPSGRRARRRDACAGGRADARATGPVLGKGDAMWRALSVLEGELVCFLDADTEDFSRPLRHRAARAAAVRARGVVRRRPSTAARSGTAAPRAPTAAGASTT